MALRNPKGLLFLWILVVLTANNTCGKLSIVSTPPFGLLKDRFMTPHNNLCLCRLSGYGVINMNKLLKFPPNKNKMTAAQIAKCRAITFQNFK